MIIYIYTWTYFEPCYPIEIQSVGKAEPSTILARASLILPELMYVSEYYILQAVVLFMNNYPHATVHYSPIIFV